MLGKPVRPEYSLPLINQYIYKLKFTQKMKNKYDSDYKKKKKKKQDKTRTGSKKGRLVLIIRRSE